MAYQLDYPLLLPRQTPTQTQQQPQTTTTVGSTGVTPIGIDNGTTVMNIPTTISDLGLSAVATGDPSVRFFFLSLFEKGFGLP